jgi:hypothetical protein
MQDLASGGIDIIDAEGRILTIRGTGSRDVTVCVSALTQHEDQPHERWLVVVIGQHIHLCESETEMWMGQDGTWSLWE